MFLFFAAQNADFTYADSSRKEDIFCAVDMMPSGFNYQCFCCCLYVFSIHAEQQNIVCVQNLEFECVNRMMVKFKALYANYVNYDYDYEEFE